MPAGNPVAGMALFRAPTSPKVIPAIATPLFETRTGPAGNNGLPIVVTMFQAPSSVGTPGATSIQLLLEPAGKIKGCVFVIVVWAPRRAAIALSAIAPMNRLESMDASGAAFAAGDSMGRIAEIRRRF